MKWLTDRCYARDLYGIVIPFLLIVCFSSQTFAQGETYPEPRTVIIARGHNTIPTGKLKVKSYRLQALGPDKFLLTIGLEDASIAGAFLIWINDDPIGAYSTLGNELTATLPLNWLEDGTVLGVSKSSTPYDITLLPERLRLPDRLKQSRQPALGERMRITSLRRVTQPTNGAPKTLIAVIITSPEPFDPVVANNSWVIQIGSREFAAGVAYDNNHVLVCSMTLEEFAELKDGDPVRVNWGFRAVSQGLAGKSFERLDKSMLDNGK